MGFLGKLLVILNGALSLLFLTWALGVYTNRMDWFSRKTASGEEVQGRVERLQAQISDLATARGRAESRLKTNSQELTDPNNGPEVMRPGWLDFYDFRLNLVQTGRGPDGKEVPDPVVEIVVQGDRLALAKQPITKPDIDDPSKQTPLRSVEYYAGSPDSPGGATAVVSKDIAEAQKETASLIEQEKKTTLEIVGPPNGKGLRTRIDEQRAIARNAANEREYLQEFLVNRQAEVQLLQKRLRSLERRIAELQEFIKKRDEE